MEFEELYDDQLIYKRCQMDFIDHLWELLSRNKDTRVDWAISRLMSSGFFFIQKTAAASTNYPKVCSTPYSEPKPTIPWYTFELLLKFKKKQKKKLLIGGAIYRLF